MGGVKACCLLPVAAKAAGKAEEEHLWMSRATQQYGGGMLSLTPLLKNRTLGARGGWSRVFENHSISLILQDWEPNLELSISEPKVRKKYHFGLKSPLRYFCEILQHCVWEGGVVGLFGFRKHL